MDELVRDLHVIPVSKNEQLEMNNLYTIEVWVHFKSHIRVALLYSDFIPNVEEEADSDLKAMND